MKLGEKQRQMFKNAHQNYTKEDQDVKNFVAEGGVAGGGAWLCGDALVACRIGKSGSIYDGVAEIILRSSTGRIRWIMQLGERAGGFLSRQINEKSTAFHGPVKRLDGKVRIDRAQQLIDGWDNKVDAMISKLENLSLVKGSIVARSGSVENEQRRRITTMSPMFLRGRIADKRSKDKRGGTYSDGKHSSIDKDKVLTSQSPPRGHRHTRHLVENVDIKISDDGTVLVDEIEKAGMKKSRNFSDFCNVAPVVENGGDCRSREIHTWLTIVFGAEDLKTVEVICKIFVDDFGYSGGMDDLTGLNDEEVAEIVGSMETFGVKLKKRQVLRRALYRLREKGDHDSDDKVASEKDTDGDFFARVENPKKLLPGSAGNSDPPPALSFQFFMENMFNMNPSGGSFRLLELLKNNPALERAVTVLDRTPPLHTSKVALLFAGAGLGGGATAEESMINATSGSPQYNEFMRSMGTIVPVRDLGFYSGGLDTDTLSDGSHALVWMSPGPQRSAKTTSGCGGRMVLFHCPTLMGSRPRYNDRKRHVGNDAVQIIWSDEPFVLEVSRKAG